MKTRELTERNNCLYHSECQSILEENIGEYCSEVNECVPRTSALTTDPSKITYYKKDSTLSKLGETCLRDYNCEKGICDIISKKCILDESLRKKTG